LNRHAARAAVIGSGGRLCAAAGRDGAASDSNTSVVVDRPTDRAVNNADYSCII